jgi:hypothetical protein
MKCGLMMYICGVFFYEVEVSAGKDCFRMSIDGCQILFLGENVMNESFKNADIWRGSLRGSYPVFPVGQSDDNFLAFQFEVELQ